MTEIECETCKGKGYTVSQDGLKIEQCTKCFGTGFVEYVPYEGKRGDTDEIPFDEPFGPIYKG